MNNRAKLLVSVLFIALIVLCICLTRFYFDVTKNTGNNDTNAEIAGIVGTYGDMRVFKSVNGYYGVLNSEDVVVIEPEWLDILEITPDLALVSRRMNSTMLIGGVDFEENIVLPFVFRSMTKLGDSFYAGVVDEDESCLIYNSSFEPVFFRSYDNASYESGILALETEKCVFSYFVSDTQPILRKAEMLCDIAGIPFEWRLGNRGYLKDLDEDDLLRINECVSDYMDMLIRSDFSGLPQISGGDYIGGLERPNSFTADMHFDEITNFSFNLQAQKNNTYVFAFTILYHTDTVETEENEKRSQAVQLQLGFRRNSNNKMILTSADLSF